MVSTVHRAVLAHVLAQAFFIPLWSQFHVWTLLSLVFASLSAKPRQQVSLRPALNGDGFSKSGIRALFICRIDKKCVANVCVSTYNNKENSNKNIIINHWPSCIINVSCGAKNHQNKTRRADTWSRTHDTAQVTQCRRVKGAGQAVPTLELDCR